MNTWGTDTQHTNLTSKQWIHALENRRYSMNMCKYYVNEKYNWKTHQDKVTEVKTKYNSNYKQYKSY